MENIVAESPLESKLPTSYGDLDFKTYSVKEPCKIGTSTYINYFNEKLINIEKNVGNKDLIYDDVLVVEDYNKDVQVKFLVSVSAGEIIQLDSYLENEVWKINGDKADTPIEINRTSEVQLSGEIKQTTENRPVALLTVNGNIVNEMVVYTSSSKYREAKSDVLKAYTLHNNLPSENKNEFSELFERRKKNFEKNDYDNAEDLVQLIVQGRKDVIIENLKNKNAILSGGIFLLLIGLVLSIVKLQEFKNHPAQLIYELNKRKIALLDKDINYVRILPPERKDGREINCLSQKLDMEQVAGLDSDCYWRWCNSFGLSTS